MARIESIEHRLRNWARWRLSQGSGVLGYASVDLTHPIPSARDPYADAPVPTNEIEARQSDDLILKLPSQLRATVHVWYIGPDELLPRSAKRRPTLNNLANRLKVLGCAEATVHERIDRAHRMLADHLAAKEDQAKLEQARVKALRPTGSVSGPK